MKKTDGTRLAVVCDGDRRSAMSPIIIFCHGLGSHKYRPLARFVASYFSRLGFTVVRFDLSGHGDSDGGLKSRLVRVFISDLKTIVTWVRREDRYSGRPIIVVGHSIGALTALLYAPSDHRLAGVAMVGCNAESRRLYDRYVTAGMIKIFKRYSLVRRTKVARNFWQDRNRLEPGLAVRKISVHKLFVCGLRDNINPVADSRYLFRLAPAPKALHIISRADHYFRLPAEGAAFCRILLTWIKKLSLT